MIAKFGLALAAFALQYLLLHSHKAGHSHWLWIASASAILFVIGSRLVPALTGGKWSITQLVISALLSLVLPPVIYVVREWVQVPGSVLNALSHDGLFYLVSVTFASGGWLFAVLLLWFDRRAAAQSSASESGTA
jgi:hypothetical protein